MAFWFGMTRVHTSLSQEDRPSQRIVCESESTEDARKKLEESLREMRQAHEGFGEANYLCFADPPLYYGPFENRFTASLTEPDLVRESETHLWQQS